MHSRQLNRLHGEAGVRLLARAKGCSRNADSERLQVTSFVLHPGSMIRTDIARDDSAAKFAMAVAAPFTKSIAQGQALSLRSERVYDLGFRATLETFYCMRVSVNAQSASAHIRILPFRSCDHFVLVPQGAAH